MNSIQKIKHDLTQIGVCSGDLVMVHASLKKVGPIDGGANSIIQSILETIGSTGTMLMVLGSPEDIEFDYMNSPADPDMGTLAECFRVYPKSIVNDHPAARFCANGSLASQLLNSTAFHDYYGKDSVLEKFTHNKGKVLRLHPDIDTTTLTHYAEYLAKVSPKKQVQRQYVCKQKGIINIKSLDDCLGIQVWPEGNYFSQIMLDFKNSKHNRVGAVGQCEADLFDAQDFVSFAVEWMESHLANHSSPTES